MQYLPESFILGRQSRQDPICDCGLPSGANGKHHGVGERHSSRWESYPDQWPNSAVADIAYHNKAVIYDILFKASAETMITIAADPKHLGACIGVLSVLHTWGSALTHHPHVHMIVPGGGISLDGTRWVACRPNFFLYVGVLSRLFRRLVLEKLAAAHAVGALQFFGSTPR